MRSNCHQFLELSQTKHFCERAFPIWVSFERKYTILILINNLLMRHIFYSSITKSADLNAEFSNFPFFAYRFGFSYYKKNTICCQITMCSSKITLASLDQLCDIRCSQFIAHKSASTCLRFWSRESEPI